MKKEREKHNSKIYTIEKIQIKKVLSHQEILYIIDIWQNFYNILLFSKEKVLCDTQHLKMETKSNLQFPVPNSSTIKLEKLYIYWPFDFHDHIGKTSCIGYSNEIYRLSQKKVK